MGTNFRKWPSRREAPSPGPTHAIAVKAAGKQGRRDESRGLTVLSDSSYGAPVARARPRPPCQPRETAPSSRLRRSGEGASPVRPYFLGH